MSYNNFSLVYDKLMSDVNYEELCSEMLSLCKKYNHTPKLVLDAACGTGEFTNQLLKNNLDVIGVDISPEMLSVARNKLGSNVTLLCQSLADLDLYGTIDTAFCTLDGLNHIIDKNELKNSLNRISLFLEPDGLFVFDVNTIYKHKNILSNNIFVEDANDVYLVWQNSLLDKNIVDINLDFFLKNDDSYIRRSENFQERAYSENELTKMLNEAGFKVLEKLDFFTYKTAKPESEKIIYVTKKGE